METNLSDVFGGKVHSFEKPIGLTEKITDIDSKIFGTIKTTGNMSNMKMPVMGKNINKIIGNFKNKEQTSPKNIIVPKINMNSKLPKNIMNMKMPSMNMPKNIMNMKMPSMNMPKNIMNMKMPSMNNKLPKNIMNMKMPSMNSKLPKNMIGEFTSKNFKMALGQVENKALSNIIRGPEKIARGRIKQQKGLPMFGDHDGDKILNILDCKPKDKKEQAFWHKWVGGAREEGESQARDMSTGQYMSPSDIEGEYQSDMIESKEEDMEIMEDTPPKMLPFMEKESKQQIIDVTPTTEEEIEEVPSAAEKLKIFQGNTNNTAIYMSTPQETEEPEIKYDKTKIEVGEMQPGTIERISRYTGEKIFAQPTTRKQLPEEQSLARIEKLYKNLKIIKSNTQKGKGIPKRTAMGMRASATFAGSQDTAKLLGIGTGPKLGLPQYITGSGLTGQGITQLSALPLSSQGLTTGYLTTTGQGLKLGYLPSSESYPVQSITPTNVAQPTPQPVLNVQAPQTTEKKIYSPYSKRRVTYTRGPYKK